MAEQAASADSRICQLTGPARGGKEVLNAFHKLGFKTHKVKGSHHVLYWGEPSQQKLVHIVVHGSKEWPPHHVKAKWKEAHRIMGVGEKQFLELLG